MEKIINVIFEVDMFNGLLETLYMICTSTVIAYLLGLPLGILTVLTKNGGLKENKVLHKILDVIINVGRSIPFIILIIVLMPLTRTIVGKSYGSTAAIISLSIAAVFFVGRMIEQSLSEIDKGIIESSVCMGASTLKIVFKVYFSEALPSLIRGVAIIQYGTN